MVFRSAGVSPGRRRYETLKIELQRKLDQPWRLGRQDLVEGWRADVAIRQTEIGVVEDVEEFRPELKLLGLRHANVLKGGEVPICVPRSLRDVAASGSELLNRRVWILNKPLKRAAH